MKQIEKFIASIFFAISLNAGACGAGEENHEQSEMNVIGAEQMPDEFNADIDEGCECGKFADEDMDGLCDLAVSGECRKARTGRCPCGGDCVGC